MCNAHVLNGAKAIYDKIICLQCIISYAENQNNNANDIQQKMLNGERQKARQKKELHDSSAVLAATVCLLLDRFMTNSRQTLVAFDIIQNYLLLILGAVFPSFVPDNDLRINIYFRILCIVLSTYLWPEIQRDLHATQSESKTFNSNRKSSAALCVLLTFFFSLNFVSTMTTTAFTVVADDDVETELSSFFNAR